MKRCFSILALVVVVLAAFGRGEARQAVTTNLVAYWPMNTFASNATPDASGNNNNAAQATAANQPAAAPGMFTGALAFDGTADFLSAPDSASLNVGTANFSVAAWVKPSGTTVDRVINKWDGTKGWLLDINTGSGGAAAASFLRLKMSDGTSTVDYFINAGLAVDAWTHIAATVDRTAKQVKLYANATLIGTLTYPTLAGTLTNTAALGIGNIPSSAGNYYGGALDEVRLYNAALTQPQVLTLVAPLPPTALTAIPVPTYGARPVDLAWTASAGSLSYRVYRSTTSGSGYVQIASGITGTTYTDNLPAYDTNFYYVVRGFNTVEGNNSNEAMAMVPKPPPRTEKMGKDHMCGVGIAETPESPVFLAALAVLAMALASFRRAS